MSNPISFQSFPNAKPYIPENLIIGVLKKTGTRPISTGLVKVPSKNVRKRALDSLDYYVLKRLKDRGLSASRGMHGRTLRGFITQNFDSYEDQDPSDILKLMTDPSSRWSSMPLSTAIEIILDEITASAPNVNAEIPFRKPVAAHESDSGAGIIFTVLGLITSAMIGVIVYNTSHRSKN
jgi:hypothetical protein